MANLLVSTAAWGAGSCSSQSHNPLLSNGRASPATGTTATTFTFSVTYADTKGCAPNWVRVTIAGVGVYSMSGSGSNYDAGVSFTLSTQLPVGTHTYSFAASSGEFGGQKTTALASVSPPSVTVTAILPPEPTPKPTPKPTPPPTPKPTPVPTPAATVAPTPSPGATATPQVSPSPAPVAVGVGHTPAPTVAGGVAAPSGEPGASQDQAQAPGPTSSEAVAPAGFSKPEPFGSFALLLGGWATATAGGLALFLFLAPRRRREEPVPAVAGQGSAPSEEVPAQAAAPSPASELVPPDEVNMPRWLRPSVQAARQGRIARSGNPRLEDS